MDQHNRAVLDGGLEGGGPGGGSDVVHQEGQPPQSRPGTLLVTALLAGLVLVVPVVWALGIYGGLVVREGLSPAASAGYLLLIVMAAGAAILYFWKQFTESA